MEPMTARETATCLGNAQSIFMLLSIFGLFPLDRADRPHKLIESRAEAYEYPRQHKPGGGPEAAVQPPAGEEHQDD